MIESGVGVESIETNNVVISRSSELKKLNGDEVRENRSFIWTRQLISQHLVLPRNGKILLFHFKPMNRPPRKFLSMSMTGPELKIQDLLLLRYEWLKVVLCLISNVP